MTSPKSETWGLGRARIVGRATRAATEVNVIISDIHAPHYDVRALSSALKLIEDIQPHRVGINGDINDFFSISSFNKGADRLDTLQDEIDLGNKIRRRVREAAPNARLDENEGNHESRIRDYVRKNARALTSLRNLNPESLFDWAQNEITPHGTNGYRLRPHFLVKHGTIIRSEGGATAKAEQLAANINGVSGHTHRLAPYRKDGYAPREWWEGGCLCRLDPDYVEVPNWRHGLLVVYLSTKTDNFKIDPVSTFNGRFTYGGKTF